MLHAFAFSALLRLIFFTLKTMINIWPQLKLFSTPLPPGWVLLATALPGGGEYNLYFGTHLFVKIPRPGDSDRVKLLPVPV